MSNRAKRLRESKKLSYELRNKVDSGRLLDRDEILKCLNDLDYMNGIVTDIVEDEERVEEDFQDRGLDDIEQEIALIGKSYVEDEEDIDETFQTEEFIERFEDGTVIEKFENEVEEDITDKEVNKNSVRRGTEDKYYLVGGRPKKEKGFIKNIIDKLF